jgi:hypothetical protein
MSNFDKALLVLLVIGGTVALVALLFPHHPPRILGVFITDAHGAESFELNCTGDAKVTRAGDRFTVQYTDLYGTIVYRSDLIEVKIATMALGTKCPERITP